jgi:hypothetical protein
MVESDGMVRTMRRIAMRNNLCTAMSEKAKVIEPTSQHRPQIIEGVINYVQVIIKALAWYNIVLKIPEYCTVFALKKKRRNIGLSHQSNLSDPQHNKWSD